MWKNKKAIQRYFQSRDVSIKNIINCAKLIYEYQNFRQQTILSTNYFMDIVEEVLKVLNTSSTMRKSVHNNLFDTIMAYRVKGSAEVAHAPSVDPAKLRQAIHNLFYVQHSKTGKLFSQGKLLVNRLASVQALFCSVSGRRWVDISRIRWEGMKFFNKSKRFKVKFMLPGSKSNFKGKRNEGVTLVQDSSDLCPIKILIHHWITMGRPRFGFVLPCVHKNVVYTTDCVEHWESFRCAGHRSGAKVRPCLGQVNGNTTWTIYKKAAVQAGCSVIPKRHTFGPNIDKSN